MSNIKVKDQYQILRAKVKGKDQRSHDKVKYQMAPPLDMFSGNIPNILLVSYFKLLF